MGNQDISLVSSTDTPEQVQAALAETPVVEETKKPDAAAPPATDDTAAADKAAADKAAADAAAAAKETPPADGEETAVQKAEKASKTARERRTEKIQSQIDKSIATREAARRDADAEEARVAALKAERAALEAELALKRATPPAPETPDAGAAKPKLADTQADGTPRYANYEEWVDAVGAWHAAKAQAASNQSVETLKQEQTQAERDRIDHARATRAEQNAVASYESKLDAFKTSTPDFDAVLTAAQEAVQEIVEDIGPDALHVLDTYTVHDAENGPAIVHYLSQHPDEMRRIAELTIPRQLAALGRLDERLAPASKKPAQRAKPPVSSAPDPITPVGGSPTSSSVPLEDEPYTVYKARREREERVARGLPV
jgi:hypothetical protein